MGYINLTKEQEKAVKIVIKDAKNNIFNDGAALCSIRQGRHLILSNWNKFVIIHTDACSNIEDGDYSVELVGKNLTFTKTTVNPVYISAGAMVEKTLNRRLTMKKYTCSISDIPAIIEINRDKTKQEYYTMNLEYLLKIGFGSQEHVVFYLTTVEQIHPFIIENYMQHITWGIAPMQSPSSALYHWVEVNGLMYGEETTEFDPE